MEQVGRGVVSLGVVPDVLRDLGARRNRTRIQRRRIALQRPDQRGPPLHPLDPLHRELPAVPVTVPWSEIWPPAST